MKMIKVSGLQLALRDGDKNLNMVSKMASEARKLDVDVICLPEAWFSITPYNILGKVANLYNEIVEQLSKISSDNGLWIIGGGLYKPSKNKKPVVSCPVINDSGELIGEQLKVHPYKVERKIFQRGDHFEIFDLKNTKCGILLCHDIVYPEAARVLVLKGAEILFNPSRIPFNAIKAWHLYIKARSLENRIPLMGVNVVLDRRYGGGSIIVSPEERVKGVMYPKVLAKAGDLETIITAEIKPEEYLKARIERLSNRHPKAYHILSLD